MSGSGELIVTVDIERQHVTRVALPPDCSLHVYDYNRRWTKEVTEPDDDGDLCKQTIWTSVAGTPKYQLKLYVREGEVYRAVMPPGSGVVVKTHGRTGDPQVRKFFRKA